MGLPPARIRKRKRALAANNNMVLSLVCLAVLLVSPTKALISLPGFSEEYISLPARFGLQLSEAPPIRTYLTIVKDQPYMCAGEITEPQSEPTIAHNSGDDDIHQSKIPYNNTLDASMQIDKHDNSILSAVINQGIIPLPKPQNNLPVTILVERGLCTFYEKAMMAAQYGAQYVIIYDDQIAPDLVPMSSDYETDMTLLFVSASTGHSLRDHIVTASEKNSYQTGLGPPTRGYGNGTSLDESVVQDDRFYGYNLVVEIDGTSPYYQMGYRGLNMAAYLLAAMSGFLAFLIFFGCLLICAQCGCITAAPDEHGRIVLFAGGPGIRAPETLTRIIRIHKLTPNQVLLLEEEEFEASGEETEEGDSHACCAICLEEFEHQEKLRVLPCGHRFHEDCLVPWLTGRHASCPLCKMDVLEHIKEIEGKKNGDKDEDEANRENDSASVVSHNNPRSFWYRLRGWSLVDGRSPPSSPQERTDADSSRSHSISLEVSEIEMETWTNRSASVSGSETVAEEP